MNGETIPVEVTLRTLPENTKGKAYQASDHVQLSDLYQNIGSSPGWKTEHRDVSARFMGFGLLLAFAAGGASLIWFCRLP